MPQLLLPVHRLRSVLGRLLNTVGDRLDERHGLPTADTLSGGPLISIVMPVYDAPERYLREALESVRAQVYQNWELCIADDASPAAHVRNVLDEFCAKEPRAKVHYRQQNGHISAASNSALDLASGDWVALLDHDDVLPPLALAHVAAALRRNPTATIVYSDEDKIDDAGRHFDQYRKPNWNPELALAHNYISHFGVYRRALVNSVGGFRVGLEGSQDHDLLLRCAERTSAAGIVHIPHVLYHWRASPSSTAGSADAKPYVFAATERAVLDHCERKGLAAAIEAVPGGWRLIPAAPLKTSAAVVTTPAGRPPTGAELAAAIASVSTEIVVVVPEDTRDQVTPGLMEHLCFALTRPGIGIAGGTLHSKPGRILSGGLLVGLGRRRHRIVTAHHRRYIYDPGANARAFLHQRVTALSGSFIAVRKDAVEAAGGVDSSVRAHADVDLCLKLNRLGLGSLWLPELRLVSGPYRRPHALYAAIHLRRRFPELFLRDPFYPQAFRPGRADFIRRWRPDTLGLTAAWRLSSAGLR